MDEKISTGKAIAEVRTMAYQFADLYFAFVEEIYLRYGEETALAMATAVLFKRARERAEAMIAKAEAEGIARIPENIVIVTDVPYLGWVPDYGTDHCPYAAAWKKRLVEHPWFLKFARLYCDVTDTTIAEVFTGRYSHQNTSNVINGAASCERDYFFSTAVVAGRYSYGSAD